MQDVAEPPIPAASVAKPYAPSPVDRLIDVVRRSGVPAWAIYASLALAMILLEVAVTSREGTFPSRFGLIHVMLPVFAVAILPALHSFDASADRALAAARPALKVDERGYEDLRYRLTTRPAGPTVLAGAAGVLALMVVTFIQPPDTYAVLHIMVTPLATVIEWIFQFLTWTGVGIVSFDIARKLRLVNEVSTRHMRISLFQARPLYAFSRLTAAMVIYTVAVVIIASIALADLAGTVQWAVTAGAASALAAVAFIAPLWGAHNLMAQEKARQLDAMSARIDRQIRSLTEGVDGAELTPIGNVKDALEGLIAARDELQSISTWPWQRETLGTVVTALIAPLGIWLLSQLLERSSLV
jgi:hypothetical protein